MENQAEVYKLDLMYKNLVNCEQTLDLKSTTLNQIEVCEPCHIGQAG